MKSENIYLKYVFLSLRIGNRPQVVPSLEVSGFCGPNKQRNASTSCLARKSQVNPTLSFAPTSNSKAQSGNSFLALLLLQLRCCVVWYPLTTRCHSPFFLVPTPSWHQVDLIILPLTSLPLVGFWKLIPTFGGCIATKAKCSLKGDNNEVVEVWGTVLGRQQLVVLRKAECVWLKSRLGLISLG